ncbi:ribosome biogenesis protein BOP1 homolog [Morus notabilis]|uniref:ribosome biogenesis protein BOP1 homolog n=1 Tax=Morus notabilis TaxID=981085 RepID=UPI000CECFA11|nr:ribosome biogenesis protein BOP1 homolog [Morus notabilis]
MATAGKSKATDTDQNQNQKQKQSSKIDEEKKTKKKNQKAIQTQQKLKLKQPTPPEISDSESQSDSVYDGDFSEDDGGSESEDYESLRDSESGESESDASGDEGDVNASDNDALGSDHSHEDQSESSDAHEEVEESDSSEDEVAPRNTVGNVPLVWYQDEDHIGYDIAGKKIKKKEREDKLQSFLASADDSKNWRKINDEYNQEIVELTKEEAKLVHRMLEGKAPHAEFDPYAPYVDWFKWDDAKHPLSNAPEPKRRFIPSKWEHKKVVALRRAIRKGFIKFEKPKEEPRAYLLWGDESDATEKSNHLAYIPAPKPKLPGHEESYNPSLEYIPTQEEINSYQLMYEEDRPKFIPRRYTSLRNVPAYENAVKESFERCLDLYLCPRVRKKRINIDPESLKPKLPSRKDLRPYPTTCYLEYRGHTDAVMSVSVEPSGQWIASGSMDGTVRVWEIETGRCLRVWNVDEAVKCVTWNPVRELPILAISVGPDVLILNTGLGNEEEQERVRELLQVKTPASPDDSDNTASIASWHQDDKHGGIRLRHFKTASSVEWHRKGDYLSVVMPAGESRAVVIHQISKKLTQRIPFKLHGLPVTSVFHPTRSIFFIATKKNVRVYELVKQKFIKKLETGLREISSISVHPAGDNLIVGSREGKLCWFDMDLSSQPYRTLKCHPKDINNVAFHRSYPLFASCSDDCTAYVFHGMVYSDLNQNPLIVPLEILRGHKSSNGRGVMDCKFHPRQPWLFTAGADSLIKLYCH